MYGLNELRVIASAALEPASWAMMIAGICIVGGSLRRLRAQGVAALA